MNETRTQVRTALILCVPDQFANAVKPNQIKAYLNARGVDCERFSTLGLGRWSTTGAGAKLPGPRPADWLLYLLEALSFLAYRLPAGPARRLRSAVLLPIMRLRAAALPRALGGRTFDLVISESNLDIGFVRGPRLGRIQMLDLPAPFAEEMRFAGELTEDAYLRLRDFEIEAYRAADRLSFHWPTYADYVRRTKYAGDNLMNLSYGVQPKPVRARFSAAPRIVFLGYLAGAWVNLPLLERLCQRFPNIDVYGGPPMPSLGTQYKGYAPSLDVLAEYQFGLVTFTDDPLRRSGFSSKQLEYYSYGLPVLTPAWRTDPLLDPAALPFTEADFGEVLDRLRSREAWEQVSRTALAIAGQCTWDQALAPLAELIAEPVR